VFCISYFLVFITTDPEENYVTYTDNNSNVFDLSIPSSINFCGEDIPKNDVRLKLILEREFKQNQYSKSATQLLFNKAQRWFAYIEPVLKSEGVPDDFKYLAVIESHLSNVYSPAGAAGFWQLIPNSAVNFGLVVNESVDERLHVEKATKAACKLILQAYKVFHNWTLSAAAYNRGINGILRAMKDQQTRDYHALLLNSETGTFVYRILAYKTLLTNPSHFGIHKKALRTLPKIKYRILKVDSTIRDLRRFSLALKIDYQVLKAHNPWLISNHLDNPMALKFEIRIPKNSKIEYANYISDLHPNAIRPVSEVIAKVDSVGVNKTEQSIFIEKETSLESIAKEFHVSAKELRKWNKLDSLKTSVKSRSLIVIDPSETVKSFNE